MMEVEFVSRRRRRHHQQHQNEWMKWKWIQNKNKLYYEIQNIIIILNIQGQAGNAYGTQMSEWMNNGVDWNGMEIGWHFHAAFFVLFLSSFLLWKANCWVRCCHFIAKWYTNANILTTSHSSWMIQLMC